jgi:hypothetical protein
LQISGRQPTAPSPPHMATMTWVTWFINLRGTVTQLWGADVSIKFVNVESFALLLQNHLKYFPENNLWCRPTGYKIQLPHTNCAT